MISFIDEHRSVLGVEPICRLLPIAPSTYYEVIARRKDVDRLSARARRDIAMKAKQWSLSRSNGSTGSTTAACWSLSETFHQPRPNNDTTPCWTRQPWPHNLNQMVSGKPGRFTPLSLYLFSGIAFSPRLSTGPSHCELHRTQNRNCLQTASYTKTRGSNFTRSSVIMLLNFRTFGLV